MWLPCDWQVATTACPCGPSQIQSRYPPHLHPFVQICSPRAKKKKITTAIIPNLRVWNGSPHSSVWRHGGFSSVQLPSRTTIQSDTPIGRMKYLNIYDDINCYSVGLVRFTNKMCLVRSGTDHGRGYKKWLFEWNEKTAGAFPPLKSDILWTLPASPTSWKTPDIQE